MASWLSGPAHCGCPHYSRSCPQPGAARSHHFATVWVFPACRCRTALSDTWPEHWNCLKEDPLCSGSARFCSVAACCSCQFLWWCDADRLLRYRCCCRLFAVLSLVWWAGLIHRLLHHSLVCDSSSSLYFSCSFGSVARILFRWLARLSRASHLTVLPRHQWCSATLASESVTSSFWLIYLLLCCFAALF